MKKTQTIKTNVTGFELTFQSCIVKNVLVLVWPDGLLRRSLMAENFVILHVADCRKCSFYTNID